MNAKQMMEKRSALSAQMDGLVKAAQAEDRNLSNEEMTKFDALDNEVKELRASADRIARTEELKKEMAAKAEEVRDNAPVAKVEARDAFNAYLRKGMNGINAAEARALAELRGGDTQITTNDGLGGFLVPKTGATS